MCSKDFLSHLTSGTGSLASMCPFQCIAEDAHGNCRRFDGGICKDSTTPIYHYHDLHPACFHIPGLTPGSTDKYALPKDIEEAIMREIWRHGSITAVMALAITVIRARYSNSGSAENFLKRRRRQQRRTKLF